MMIYISKLKELNKTSVNIAGGKGASLGEMLNSGINVPDGGEITDNINEINNLRHFFLEFAKNGVNSGNKLLNGETVFSNTKLIKGNVIIIKDKKDLVLKHKLIKNKIVVAIQTTPHFIPYLKHAKAIITDEGGITCHAAIISRELKIPCIVGTKHATHILKDGDFISINMSKGVIEKLKQ